MAVPTSLRLPAAFGFWIALLAASPPCFGDGALQLYTVTPCRIVDTRGPGGPTGGPALTSGAIRAFPVRNYCQIPSTARGVSLNVAVVGPTAGGFFTVWTYNMAWPGTSNINLSGGEPAVANGAIVLVTGDPQFDLSTLYQAGPGSTAHLIVDVNGYLQ
jgi:hypothetical protein